MTVREVIESADRLRANPLSDKEKIEYLSELDMRIYEDIVLRHQGSEIPVPRTFPYTADTAELIAPARFKRMYVLYLCLEIDWALDETEHYTNDLIRFQDAYEAFAAWYNETHLPVQAARICTAPPYRLGGAYASGS